MPSYEAIRVERKSKLVVLTIARPDAGNAIDLTVARELMDATAHLTVDPDLGAVLLRTEGPRFCVGGDLKSFAREAERGRHLTDVTGHLHVALARLARLDAPVVVAVQGVAAGAGCSLALAGDLLVAGASARFVLAYTDVGLSPDAGATWYLPRLVGLRRALDLTLTNRQLTATEAESWGIVSRVVPDDELAEEAEALASRLAAGPTLALGSSKRLLRESLGRELEGQLEQEARSLAIAADAADGREGIDAFVAKRPPTFGAG